MKRTIKITLTAIFATLCYVAFYFIKIDIPTPAGFTSVHMGNALCCLSALLLGGNLGGLAGAIGMGIGDLFSPIYVITVPKTIILKYIMGCICGYFGKEIFNLENKEGKKLYIYTALSISIAMLANVILEPLFSYFYYGIILSNATKAQGYLTLAKWVSTSINAIISILVATPLYVFLRKTVKNLYK